MRQSLIIADLRVGETVLIETESGNVYAFQLERPRAGTLEGGGLDAPDDAVLAGAYVRSCDPPRLSILEIHIGDRVRFACARAGRVITSAVTGLDLIAAGEY